MAIIAVGALAFLLSGAGASTASPVEELQMTLVDQLSRLSQQIGEIDKEVVEIKDERRTLRRELKLVAASLKKLDLEIQKTKTEISGSEVIIAAIEERVREVTRRIEYERTALGELLRSVDERDDLSALELVLSAKSLSDFWSSLRALENLQDRIQRNIASLKDLRFEYDTEVARLDEKLAEQRALEALQQFQEAELAAEQDTKEALLAGTFTKEESLARILVLTREEINRVKAQIFLLADSGAAVSLEEALARATPIARAAGIRTSFLLAVLEKESRLGAHIGTGQWRVDMHPRDWAAFLEITSSLGLDPDLTPVSKKPWYGWGGAMGPAQFLPSTWLAWKERIVELTGHRPPSPWNLDDAMAGAALKLADAGASLKTRDAEYQAAMIYFAGGNWRKPELQFYGEAVTELTELLEAQVGSLSE